MHIKLKHASTSGTISTPCEGIFGRLALLTILATKDLSILSRVIGQHCNRAKEELPVPKWSIDSRMATPWQ
jgi:hypothetical protein